MAPSPLISRGTIYYDPESPADTMGQGITLEQDAQRQSVDAFLDLIAAERLSRMPHSGSEWDCVLRNAESFARYVACYQRVVEEYLPSSDTATAAFWTNCCLLLELGRSQAPSLGPAFQIFHDLSLNLAVFERQHTLLTLGTPAKEYLGKLYAALHNLVADVATCYQEKIKAAPTTQIVLDFKGQFGGSIHGFHKCQWRLVDAIWAQQIQTATAAGTGDQAINYQAIRNSLMPRDQTIAPANSPPIPGSCLWFDKHFLAHFQGSSKALVVTGKPGCGKSVLFHWITARLQRHVLGIQYNTISCSIDIATPIDSSSVHLIRHFLLQLLDQNLGNLELLSELANADQNMSSSLSLFDQESTIWQCFERALGIVARSQEMVILVDGLDGITGGDPAALDFLNHLIDVTAKFPKTKAIILSRPLSNPFPSSVEQFSITPEQTLGDMTRTIGRTLEVYPPLQSEPAERRFAVINRLAHNANGSFFSASVALELLQKERTLDAFIRNLDKTPKNLSHLLQRLISTIDFHQDGVKAVVSWLIVALRPLSLSEIALLAGPDARKLAIGPTHGGSYDVVRFTGSLFDINEGVVRFRHNILREYLLDMSSQGKILMPLKDAHRDFLLRLLRTVHPNDQLLNAPTMDQASSTALAEAFKMDSLFGYAARYWIIHFHQSSLRKDNGDLVLSPESKKSFPSTVALPIAEGAIWEASPFGLDLAKMHTLALQIRRGILDSSSPAMLQSLINVALLFDRLGRRTEANQYFYETAASSLTILGPSSAITFTFAGLYMDTQSSHSAAASHKEMMLKILLENSHSQPGDQTNEQLNGYKMALSDVYSTTGREDLAITVLDELHDATLSRFGNGSMEADSIAAKLASMLQRTSLKGGGDTIKTTSKLYNLAVQTMDTTDPRRIAATVRMAEAYESQKDFNEAENILIKVWKQTTEAHRTSPTNTEIQDLSIGAAITYLDFLRRQSRDAEFASILFGLCSECEQISNPSEMMVNRLKQLARMLSSAGYPTEAFSILASVRDLCADRQAQEGTDTIASSLVEAMQKLQAQTEQPEVVSKFVAKYEPAMRKALQQRFQADSRGHRVDEVTVRMYDSLSAHYASKNQWANVIVITRESLQLLWPAIMEVGKHANVPKEFERDAWTFAERLAHALTREDRFKEAHSIYLSLYDASTVSITIDARCLQSIYQGYACVLSHMPNVNAEVHQQVALHYYMLLSKLHPLQYEMLSQAALALGEANERSDTHRIRAPEMYERAIEIAKKHDWTGSRSIITQAEERLQAIYQAVSLDPSSWPSNIVQHTIEIFLSKYNDSRAYQGCSDQGTLDAVTQLVSLYHRSGTEQNDARAIDTLKTLVVDIFAMEASPLRLLESARQLVTIYLNNGYEEPAVRLSETLRRQAVFEYPMQDDGFNLVSSGPLDRRHHVFVAKFEEGLAGAISFSEIMADLLTVTLLLEQFAQTKAFDQKLIAAARLRRSLVNGKRFKEVNALDHRAYEFFLATLNVPSSLNERNIREFLVRTFEQLQTDEISIGKAAGVASNSLILVHLEQDEFADAYEVAFCAYHFANSLGAHQDSDSIWYGFNLALYMTGRGGNGVATSESLRGRMHDLAKLILERAFDACRRAHIEFTSMPLSKLKEIADMLKELHIYADLEWLLTAIWSSRATQKAWSPRDIIWLGKRFVEVRSLRGQQSSAIQLCEDIVYNLTALWGALDLVTLEMSIVLSDLHSTSGHYQEAMAVHEDILRLLIASDLNTERVAAALIAKKHLRFLKQISQRSGSSSSDTQLLQQLSNEFGEDLTRCETPTTHAFEKPGASIHAAEHEDDETAEILFTPRKGLRRNLCQ